MISTVTTSVFARSFSNRNVVTISEGKKTTQMRYFDNLQLKFNARKPLNIENSFEFSFDDMF